MFGLATAPVVLLRRFPAPAAIPAITAAIAFLLPSNPLARFCAAVPALYTPAPSPSDTALSAISAFTISNGVMGFPPHWTDCAS